MPYIYRGSEEEKVMWDEVLVGASDAGGGAKGGRVPEEKCLEEPTGTISVRACVFRCSLRIF